MQNLHNRSMVILTVRASKGCEGCGAEVFHRAPPVWELHAMGASTEVFPEIRLCTPCLDSYARGLAGAAGLVILPADTPHNSQ